ncbi:RluA family pseudouridine synthase [Candidatus Shikimatogenerans bostrichidophilus]|uniref:RluA family pseudouridine synthase n=1 Tax=Candidatus Shikimatogenerans bostrichidophilus TaxID=2943807 RepID=UPI00296734E1
MLKKKIIYINKKNFTKNIRIDKFLFNYFKKKNISRQKIQNNIKIGNVLLNNNKIKKNNKLNINDKIIFNYKKNFFNKKKKYYILPNKNIKINIHYEDNDILIINKQPGLIVHPGHGNYKNTLINWLKYYYYKKKINYFNYFNYRLGLLHRLDKNTSGLLIIAKNINSYNYLKLQFLNKKIKKKYIALVWGKPIKKNYIIKNYIGRNIKNRIKMKVYSNKKYGKLAITKYKIIKNYNFLTLIKCITKTGRTHQIRVHFNYIGNPIFNDDIYGGNKILYKFNKFYNKLKYTNTINNCFKLLPRQALHAYYLKFKHPITKKKIKFIINIPNDIKNLINYLK